MLIPLDERMRQIQEMFAPVVPGPAGRWTQAAFRLYIASNPIGPNSVLADFTPASYDGYGDLTAGAWDLPTRDVDGTPYVVSQMMGFAGATPQTTPQVVLGLVVMDSTSTVLLGVFPFDVPYPVSLPNQGPQITLRVSAPDELGILYLV